MKKKINPDDVRTEQDIFDEMCKNYIKLGNLLSEFEKMMKKNDNTNRNKSYAGS